MPEVRVHPDVPEVRWQIYAKEKKWEACVDIGNAIMTADPPLTPTARAVGVDAIYSSRLPR